jgi:hypothetical protein
LVSNKNLPLPAIVTKFEITEEGYGSTNEATSYQEDEMHKDREERGERGARGGRDAVMARGRV